MKRWPLWAIALAAACILLGAWHFGGAVEGYQHARHPLATLGANGAPGWRIANLVVFVMPGVLLMAVAWTLRGHLSGDAAWALRMALQFGLLAALGYALQGLCNLDPTRLPDEGANRWHAAVWLLWWLAFALSASLAGLARGLSRALRVTSLALTLLMPLMMLGLLPMPAALLHRIGIGLWLAWWWAMAVALKRDAPSPKPVSASK